MKYFFSFLSLLIFFWSMGISVSQLYADAGTVSESILFVPNGTNSADAEEVSVQDNFLKTVQVYLLGAYAIVAIWSLIFIGYRLFTAHGEPEEFKKAWIALIYIIVGLVIAPIAYVAVKIVWGFSF